MSVSEKISQLRKNKGLSQEALAEQLGVSRQTVLKWESGEAVPDTDNIISLSRLFNVSTDSLLIDEEPEPVIQQESVQTVPVQSVPVEASGQTDDGESAGSSFKKVIAVILALCVVAGAACFPLYSKSLKKLWNKMNGTEETKYTYVLVHGLGGWGDTGGMNTVSNYWGATTGSLVSYLKNEGYEVCAPSVGPVSSAWDRACELYAQLTGTRVDYGEAHSKAHNHERYGRTYATAAVPDWGKDKKINLIGHSFGGATVRLLASLLENGDEAEKAAGGEISPLFEGGKGNWVFSVTTLCAPHNGSSLTCIIDSLGGVAGVKSTTALLAKIIFSAADILAPASGIYDFMLDQFGIANENASQSSFNKTLEALTAKGNNDNAAYDLSPDGAAELNKKIKTVKNIYYFSYSYCTTKSGALLNCQVPTSGTLPILLLTATAMGSFNGRSSGGIQIDDSWKPNDGLVSVVSAQYPAGEEHIPLPAEISEIKKGIWNVAETRKGDHGTVIGLNASETETHKFYDDLFTMTENLK